MKYLVTFLILICLFTACKKNKYGSIQQRIKCTSGPTTKSKSLKATEEQRYSQFGDYIMSLTPDSFIVKLLNARYFDSRPNMGNALVLLGPETAYGGEGISADFSRDSIISIVPMLQGNVYQNGEGGFYKDEVTFDLFYMLTTFKMQIKLPAGYNNITLQQFINTSHPGVSQQNGNVINTNQYPLNKFVEELKLFNIETMQLYFGRTDSTYIGMGNNLIQGFGDPNTPHIRSAKFEAWTLIPPLYEVTRTITSTIGFDYDNIIQVYAGTDNVPYTMDDIFVFEPKFWERMSLHVEIDESN